MRVIILGAGALGSFVGGMLSKKHDVIFIGRKKHIDTVKKNGLKIRGKTECIVFPKSKITGKPDLIVVTVKAYDTQKAIEEYISLVGKNTIILSLQNGLGNEETIATVLDENKVIGGVTSHGLMVFRPGEIYHSGVGETIIGELNGEITESVKKVADALTECNIETRVSKQIKKDIWCKAIVNAAINPLTAIVKCKNGYLLKNDFLKRIMREVCTEGITVAQRERMKLEEEEVIKKVENVAYLTKNNYSSMFQSIMQGKKTEIEEINGEIVKRGEKFNVSTPINFVLYAITKALEEIAAVTPKGTDL